MKKLLILGPPFDYYKGGAEYQYKILEENLKDKYDIYYLFRHDGLAGKNHITYKYLFRKNYNENLPTDIFQIYRQIKKISPDIIYKQGVDYDAAIGAKYAKDNDISFVLHIASQKDVEKKATSIFKMKILFAFHNRINNYAIQNASKIVCQANYQNALLQENFNKHCDLILPNFHPIPKNIIHKDVSIVRILWIANIKKLKQPEIFIELSQKFIDYKNVIFLMIGRPETGLWFQGLQNAIIKTPNLQYSGELSIAQVNTELSKAHVLVNTSQYEGFSNTYIQAWMQKVPVVALNSDPDDIIKNKKIGFHSKSVEQLVRDVKFLIDNKGIREEMGENAQLFAFNTFSTSNISKLSMLFDSTK